MALLALKRSRTSPGLGVYELDMTRVCIDLTVNQVTRASR